MTHANNTDINHPELIAMCINCTCVTCEHGICARIIDRASELRGKKRNRKHRGMSYEYRGESHTLKEWAEITGVNYSTIMNRRRTGGTIEDWLGRERKPRTCGRPNLSCEYRGESHTFKEWAEILGINYETILARRRLGGTAEDWLRPTGERKKRIAHAQ